MAEGTRFGRRPKLIELDQLQQAFRAKALEDRDVGSGLLLLKVAERRATLLGLNAPQGHVLQVIQHEPAAATNFDRENPRCDRSHSLQVAAEAG